jgi:hypothetical protein
MGAQWLRTDCGFLLMQVGGVFTDGDLVFDAPCESDTVFGEADLSPNEVVRAAFIRSIVG